ncbi:hypothetical protein ACFU1R_00895 [Priestia megaterium]|uniref:DUF7487 domain-containing protein n=1 Tax=Priestia megaterium TaxID=1404 RepID=UPI00366C31C9
MILTKIIQVRWHSKTKSHYDKILNSAGCQKYIFTRFGKEFEVQFKDIHPNCTAEIELRCDYCLIEHTKIYRNWKIHFDKSGIKKDSCNKCRGKKIAESNLLVYGTTNVMHLGETKNKLIQTNMKRYGVSNVSQNKEIIEKIKETSLKKYGTEYYFQTDDFKEKYRKSMQKRYGVNNSFQAKEVKEKSKQTMLENYGVEYNMQNANIRKKAVTSMYKKGTTPTSKPQLYLHGILGGLLNYPFERYNLDIAFPENKIAIEYDGGAHDLKVKLGGITQEEFKRREIIRGTYLKREGWKLIKIVSKYDILPSKVDLLKMVKDSQTIFSRGNTWVKFNIDNSTISYNNHKEEYKITKVQQYKQYIKKIESD